MASQHKNHQTEAGAIPRRTQMFALTTPHAKKVQVVGDFTRWTQNPINLTKVADDIWRTAVTLEPGTHYYRFLVDGEWRDDPACGVRVPNPFGQQNCVRQVA